MAVLVRTDPDISPGSRDREGTDTRASFGGIT
jgi:hypothetical protein